MRFIFVSLFSLVFSELVLGIERYSDTYDDIDVDSIIKSDRLLIQYVNCILDKGPCTVDGRSLKYTLPEAITTKCEKCSDKQKRMIRRVSNHLKNNKPNIWAELLEKYDPDKEYIAAYEQFLAQGEAYN